jgi:hypothetical protein
VVLVLMIAACSPETQLLSLAVNVLFDVQTDLDKRISIEREHLVDITFGGTKVIGFLSSR